MLKFLPGIVGLQIITAIFAFVFYRLADGQLYWLMIVASALAVGIMTAAWFGTLVGHEKKQAIAKADKSFSREREKIRIDAEKAKLRLIEKNNKRLLKQTSRAEAKANFKVGATLVGALLGGAVMLVIEFVTLGLLTMTGAGGALAGYFLRARQERLKRLQAEDATVARRMFPVSASGGVDKLGASEADRLLAGSAITKSKKRNA